MTNWTSSTDHQRALAESRRAERRKRQKLERDIAAARRESKKYRLEAARHRNACKALRAEGARLKEESARHRDMWSARGKGVPEWEMGDAPADPRAIHAHVMEVLAAIRRDKGLPREVSDLARKKMGVVLGRLE